MHINSEIALDLMEGRLDNVISQQWTRHVETCSQCSTTMTTWQEFIGSLKRPHLESAPQSMLEAASALFQPKPAEPSTLRRVVAALSFDSLLQPALAGARGTSAVRQVILRAEEFDIHLRIWASAGNRELLGQIQPRGTNTFNESARLHLLQNGERISSADVNELGEFHFTFVPEGLISLQIDLPHLTVVGALDMSEKAY